MPKIKITLVHSTICAVPKHRKIVKALGLGKLNSSVIQQDNPAIRGMTQKVRHLVKVEPIAIKVEPITIKVEPIAIKEIALPEGEV